VTDRATELLRDDAAGIARAAELLRAGELVAIPTETVYGLAVRADDAAAVGRLFAAKGRPADNPLIVHVAEVADVLQVAREVTPLAQLLLTHLAPGPLTVVMEARDDLPRAVTAGLDSVAVRIPDHPVAREILRAAGVALAAPSANRSGRPSPTRAAHVLADLGGMIAAVLDGGVAAHGLESTVVDARGEVPLVLREGAVSREELAWVLSRHAGGGSTAGQQVARLDDVSPGTASAAAEEGARGDDAARSPGLRHRHYAPDARVVPASPDEVLALVRAHRDEGRSVGVVSRPDTALAAFAAGAVVLARPEDAIELAHELFAALRAAEDAGLDVIVVETVTEVGIGRAVMDRLRRAADASR